VKITLALTILGLAACTTATAPQELLTARTAYDGAAHGPAAQAAPADLHTARESLEAAERSFEADGDTEATRDLAYTATRKAELAEARARALIAAGEKERTVADMNATVAAKAMPNAAEVGAAERAMAAQSAQLSTETARRKDAERRAADLLVKLEAKQEARGVVISLSGSVLFETAKWDLLPSAQQRLSDVAEAIVAQDPESKIVVEGYTDSQGSQASNMTLSQRRAESVRAFLVSRGVAADRIRAIGYGPAKPIADNRSPEGRANNRRVEIVISKK
jgi:outer membrane protein OmpA-like peptidoglycan-associated protein